VGTPHISASPGEISERILLPGDPLRAKYIAENYLNDPVLFNEVRGMLGYTGAYKGKSVSVMGTGMGIPSISIYVNELIEQYGVKKLIRVGTCGALSPDLSLLDVILASGCCTDSGFLRHVFRGEFAPLADFDMLNTAHEKSESMEIRTFTGLLKSTDTFYSDPVPEDDQWTRYGVLGVEMEGAALYTLAAKYGVQALVIATVSDSPFDSKELTATERERSLDDMISIALETIIEV